MFSAELTTIMLSYLRMRLAFMLQDKGLIGASFALHSGLVTMVSQQLQQGFFSSTALGAFRLSATDSRRYLKLAKDLQVKSQNDTVKLHILICESMSGVYTNLPAAMSCTRTAVPLARYLENHAHLHLIMQMRVVACINFGDFRAAWSMVQAYYFSAIDEQLHTETGRAVTYRTSRVFSLLL